MRITLRRFLSSIAVFAAVLMLAAVAGRGGAMHDRHFASEPVVIRAFPVQIGPLTHPSRRAPSLEFLSGLELRGQHPNFGGLSAVRLFEDGRRFLSVTDQGDWVSGELAFAEGRLAGVENVVIAPVLAADGRRAKDQGLWDTESVAWAGRHVFVGVEREHAVLAFDWGNGGVKAPGKSLPLPDFVRQWPRNAGIEALGVLPAPSAYAGRLIGIAERAGGRDGPTEGFVMRQDGSEPFRFTLPRDGRFDVTDLDFMPNGDLIVLERYFRPIEGVAMRFRRIPVAAIQPNAVLPAEEILRIGPGSGIDNMEGLSINRNAAGDLIFTLVSDDNFSVVQRTLVLQFRWLGRD